MNELIVTFEGDHIKVVSNGEKSYESSFQIWTEVRKASLEYDCFKVLGVADTVVPMSTFEAYDHVTLFSELGINRKYRIAWVELNPEAYGTTYFIETVLSNRGFTGKLFSNVADAQQWLLGDES